MILAATAAAVTQGRAPIARQGNEWVQEIFRNIFRRARSCELSQAAGRFILRARSRTTLHTRFASMSTLPREDRARRELSHMKFTTFSSGDAVVLQADCEGSKQGSIDFDIKVPAQTQLVHLQTEGGAVAAKNLSGQVEAKTGGGGIQLDSITGVIAVSSGGGYIDIGKVGNDVEATTGGGSIRPVSAAGHVTARSGRREFEHQKGQGDDAANCRRVDPGDEVRWQDQG